MIHILGEQNSIFNTFIAQVRDKSVQTDSMRFRRNMERIGEVMAYEISRTLDYRTTMVETPLGEAVVEMIGDNIVLATVLRAGLPLHQGFMNYYDDAESVFVAAYRKSSKDGSFKVKVEYVSSCSLEGKTLILVDPMLATGGSAADAITMIKKRGCKQIRFMCLVASPEGVKRLQEEHPDVDIYTAALDDHLNEHAYIRRLLQCKML